MWARFDDQFWTHRKVILAGNEATGAFVRIVCCCAQRLSNGRIDHATALLIAAKQKVLDRLVEVGMLERAEDGFIVHDWRDWQPSAEEVAVKRSELAAKRAEAGRRGASARWQNGKTDGKDVATPSQGDGPVPVPVPEETPNGVSSGDARAPADPGPIALEAQDPPSKAAKKPRKQPDEPPPFAIGQAFEALATTSAGRFVPGVERDWTKGTRIAVAKLIRQYPSLDDWKTVGAWLAAGGEHFRGVVGPAWAASTAMANAMALAIDWHGKGRGPVRQTPRPEGGLFGRPAAQRPPPLIDPLPPDPASGGRRATVEDAERVRPRFTRKETDHVA